MQNLAEASRSSFNFDMTHVKSAKNAWVRLIIILRSVGKVSVSFNKILLRGLVLPAIYALGIAAIIASGSGGNSSAPSTSCGIVVTAIAPATDGSGDIWVGALTKTASGDVNSAVRLDSAGTEIIRIPVASGDANVIRSVAIATDGSNDVYVGGDFSEGIFRLNADGSADSGFDVGSGFDGRVSIIVPATDGSGDVYVGGYFSAYDGAPVSGLVRLNADGSLDSAGFIAAGAFDINSIALATDVTFLGYIYTGGTGVVQRRQPNGLLDNNFNPPISGVLTIAVAADPAGTIYVGGPPSLGIVRVNSGGSIDGGFSTGNGFDSEVHIITPAGDMTGDIYAGGWFTTFDDDPAGGIVRLNIDGSRDLNFLTGSGFEPSPKDPSASPSVETVVLAGDLSGDIYVGGGFAFYDGIPGNGIVRLHNDGSRDLDFSINMSSDQGPCTDANYLGFDS